MRSPLFGRRKFLEAAGPEHGEALVGALTEASIGERIEHGDAQPPAALDFDPGNIASERIRESIRRPRAATRPGPDENRA